MPVYSMTGYATGQSPCATSEPTAAPAGPPLGMEIRSVNSRFLDLGFRLSDELRPNEPALRELIGARIKRGKVEVRAWLEGRADAGLRPPTVAELVAASIVVIVFLQLPATIFRNRMTRTALVLVALRRRAPALHFLVESAFVLFSMAVFGVLSKVAWHAATVARATNEEAGVHGIFSFPTWPLKMLISCGSALSVAALLLLLWQGWRALRAPGRTAGGEP